MFTKDDYGHRPTKRLRTNDHERNTTPCAPVPPAHRSLQIIATAAYDQNKTFQSSQSSSVFDARHGHDAENFDQVQTGLQTQSAEEHCYAETLVGNEHGHGAQEKDDDARSIVCFGMFEITQLRVHKEAQALCKENFTESFLREDNIYIGTHESQQQSQNFGKIVCNRSLQILKRLRSVNDIILEIFCCKFRAKISHNRRRKPIPMLFKLLVNLYGKQELFDNIGQFFGRLCIHLCDPIVCGRNVPYTNPHILLDESETLSSVMTDSFQGNCRKDLFIAPGNMFDEIVQSEDIPEAIPPSAVLTNLHKHQKQALHFMLQREVGYRLDKLTGKYAVHDSTSQFEDDIRGGLIADQMGLGKTLQVISLIASDVDNTQSSAVASSMATLVIVPLSLLQTWKDQLISHLKAGSLEIQLFYGKGRKISLNNLQQPGIVLTTYKTVVAEFRNKAIVAGQHSIFDFKWRRIVLDEAHVIRNSTSLGAEAICALDASCRWAVTGTPIQNHLSDLFSLLCFIRVSPFNDLQHFETMIIKPWIQNQNISAVQVLKCLIQSIAIRRKKAGISLPPREDQIRKIQFSPNERRIYEELRCSLNHTIPNEGVDDYQESSVFRWIDRLRCVCSRGIEARDTSLPDHLQRSIFPEDDFGLRRTENLFDTEPMPVGELIDDDEQVMPQNDLSDVSRKHRSAEEPKFVTSSERRYSSYLHADYGSERSAQYSRSECSPSSSQASDVDDFDTPMFTKFHVLLNDLESHDGKSVVFSFWRSTLSAVSTVLSAAEVSHLIVDGSKPVNDRNAAIESFRRNPSIKVLLITISAGGVGLDLTVANQVCLIEPQWNPTVEEQALSRVHRMNQKRPVTTIRYIMEKSIEESVLDLQRRKSELAAMALDQDHSRIGKQLLQDLAVLLS